jgi:hypothetical protein
MPSRAELVNRANVMGLNPANYPNDSKLEQKVIYLETNAATMAGTLATGVLTASGVFSDTETITIGSITYTMKTALTGAKATGVLTGTDVFSDGETIRIGNITYTMRTALTGGGQPFEVLIGASLAASLDNLKIAINDSGGTEGTEYGVGTYAHPQVTATTNTNTAQTVEARDYGTSFNNLPTSEGCANASWGGTTLSGGVATVPNEVLIGAAALNSLDNLKSAINDTGTEGTDYSVGTAAHPEVTATTNTDTEQTVQAIDMAIGEDLGTTETCANAAWGATTLASGVADQNAVDATAKAQTSGGKNVG